MPNNKFDPNYLHEKIKNMLIGGEKRIYNIDSPQEYKIKIRPNKKVSPAKFLPDPLIPGGYIAHPDTIRAMRKDILIAGEDLDENELIYECQGCHNQLDLQFWLFCPYCGKAFPKDI